MSRGTPFDERMERALLAVGAALSGGGEAEIPRLLESSGQDGPDLFDQAAAVPEKESPQAAETARRTILAVGEDIWENFEYALRAEPPRTFEVARYAILAVREGRGVAADRSRTETRSTLSAAFKVRREVFRFLGILRFAPDEGGTYRAVFEPDNDILELLIPFFLRRFGTAPFSIADLRRNRRAEARDGRVLWTAAVPSSGESARDGPTGIPNAEAPAPSEDAENLWRAYYNATENPSRSNPALRLQFLPRRYWNHLPELDGERTKPHDPGDQ